MKDDYFAAFNAGNSEAVMALFTPDASFASQFFGDSAEPILRAFWEEELVWNAAQGTIMTTHNCVVIDEAPGAVTVECDHGTHNAPAQAVDAVAVPTTTTMKITPDGIGEFHELFGYPDFNFVGVFFGAWMVENHPDDAVATGFGNWSSLEESQRAWPHQCTVRGRMGRRCRSNRLPVQSTQLLNPRRRPGSKRRANSVKVSAAV